ncbi:MAG: hypothetical protein V3V67_14910 [Myxococcota bacterium]
MTRALAALALLGLALGGCATRAPQDGFTPIDFEREQILERLRELQASGAERRTIRAEGSLRVKSPSGSGRFRQIILAERPTRLRLESQNPLGQTLSLLVTDGREYSFYDGEQINSGLASPFVLADTLGLDLRPGEAVDALLVSPLTLRGTPRAVFARDLDREVWMEFERLRFAPNGDLQSYTALDVGGNVRWNAEYGAWQSVPGGRYPFHLVLSFPRTELRAELELRSVELNPELDRALFRAPDRTGR